MSIEQTIADAVSEAMRPEKIKAIIEPQIERMMSDSLNDLFRHGGVVRKSVDQAIREQIEINPDRISLKGYNKMMLAAIKKSIDATQDNALAEMVSKQLSEIFKDPPKEITTSELVNRWVDQYEDRDPEDDFDDYFSIREVGGEDVRSYFVLTLKDKNIGEDISIQVSDHRIIHVKVREWGGKFRQTSDPSFAIGIYNVEREIFQMYASETKVTNNL
ncbi:hypothetical protein [Thalassospira xiamenensis]|uniref:hypothetical protein n=1 Tax=Thalassospira xiamenensis TaxID=220697 RepID=UPI003AA9911B